MSDDKKRSTPGFIGGAKYGAGWALGFGAIMGIASTLRQGSSPTLKAAIKVFLRTRHGLAEATESARDLYAEAQSEYHSDMQGDAAAPRLQGAASDAATGAEAEQ